MTHKEKAEQYVREKLPELMSLSRGCLVTLWSGAPATLNKLHSRTDGKHDIYLTSERDGQNLEITGATTKDVEDLIIIGHPIQLQHWLRALFPNHRYFMKTVSWPFTYPLRECRGEDSVPR